MSRRAAAEAAAVAYALVDVAVIMAPALVLSSSSYRSGVSGTPGLDLVLASAVVGAGHAVVAWARLRAEVRVAARRLDVWIASIDALVVLAVGVSELTGRLLFRWLERSTSVVRVTGDGAHFVGGRPRISGHGGSTQG